MKNGNRNIIVREEIRISRSYRFSVGCIPGTGECSVLHLGQRLLIGVHPGCEECRVRAGKACITCTVECSVLKQLLAFVACLSGP